MKIKMCGSGLVVLMCNDVSAECISSIGDIYE